jgi:hypothetical protein
MTDDSWQALAIKLSQFDDTFPIKNIDAMRLLERIVRDSRMRAAQMIAQCNYQWAQEPSYQKRVDDTRARLERSAAELAELWPGVGMQFDGDPRGMVVRILLPNGRGDCWGGGVGVA